MTEKAAALIVEKWSFIRQREKNDKNLTKIMPISIRSLESLIRISTAYAKLRLSKKVEVRDVVNALKIFLYAFYNGYEKIDENFFMGYENYLKEGRE